MYFFASISALGSRYTIQYLIRLQYFEFWFNKTVGIAHCYATFCKALTWKCNTLTWQKRPITLWFESINSHFLLEIKFQSSDNDSQHSQHLQSIPDKSIIRNCNTPGPESESGSYQNQPRTNRRRSNRMSSSTGGRDFNPPCASVYSSINTTQPNRDPFVLWGAARRRDAAPAMLHSPSIARFQSPKSVWNR